MLSFGFLTVFFGNFGQSFFISWFGASIQEQLGLSATAYGSAYSSATLASGLCIMAFGGIIDKVKLHYFIMVAGTGLIIASLSMWKVSSFIGLVFSFFLLRFFGQGLLPHISSTTMARYFSASRGKALSIANNGVPVGEIILPLLAVFLISVYGWQSAWLLIAISVPLIFFPLTLWLLKKAPEPESQIQPNATATVFDNASRRTLLADYRFWLALPLVIMGPFTVTGIFIHQGFITAEKQWSLPFFALCFTLYGGIHWLTSVVSGAMVDRFSARKLFSLTGVPFAAGLLLTGLFDGQWLALVLMAFLGMGIGMMSTVIGSVWAEVYGTKNLGSIRALVTSIMIISTSVSPILLGFFIDRQISGNQFLLALGSYALAATILSLFTYGKE